MLEHENVPGVVESLKVVTEESTTRLCRFAFDYARENGRKKVTLVHKAVSSAFIVIETIQIDFLNNYTLIILGEFVAIMDILISEYHEIDGWPFLGNR